MGIYKVVAWWEKASLPPTKFRTNKHSCFALSRPFLFRPLDKTLWQTNIVVFKSVSQSLFRYIFYFVYRDHPGFQNISLNVFSKVYLILLPIPPLLFKVYTRIALQYYHQTFEVCLLAVQGAPFLVCFWKGQRIRRHWVVLRCETDPKTDAIAA